MKEVKITIKQTLSKDFKISVDDNESIIDAFKEQRYDIPALLKVLESYLTSELYFQDRRTHRVTKLLEMISSCKSWSLVNTEINETDRQC